MNDASPPDPSARAARHAYRRELRAIAVVPRRVGVLLLVMAGAFALLPWWGVHDLAGWSPRFVALVLAGVAWAFLGFAMWVRARYHRRRVRG